MKKLLSLILAMLMMVSLVPSVMAAGADTTTLTGTDILGKSYTYAANTANDSGSDFTEMPAITAVGEGVSSGDTLFGASASPTPYAQGDSIAEKLSDGYYFTYGEKIWTENAGVLLNSVATEITTNAPADSTANMVKFTQVNSGIDFTWTTAQKVARLHLWAWPADAIDSYEVQYQAKADGPWYTVKNGSLDYNVSTGDSATNSTFYQIILDETVTAVGLRFVITSFAEGHDGGVYIAEAVPRSTNEINLMSNNPIGTANQSVNSYAASRSIYVDRSVRGYHNANGTSETIASNEKAQRIPAFPAASVATKDLTLNTEYSKFQPGNAHYWRAYRSSRVVGETTYYDHADPFYAADFGEVKQKINQIKFYIHTSSITDNKSIQSVQLWCSNVDSAFENLKTATTDAIKEIDWFFVGETTPVDQGLEQYFRTKTYYTASFADAPEARYWMIRFVMPDGVTETLSAIVNAGMYSLSDYEASGLYNGDSSKLNDDVRLTYREWRVFAESSAYDYNYKTGGAAGLKNAYFLHFDKADTGIEWKFDQTTTVKAVDLWTWPAYAINNYELWYDDNGTWVKAKEETFNPLAKARGNVSVDSNNENRSVAYWNSIVLDEAIETNKLKFVIKDLNDDAYGAYITEADVRGTTDRNLVARDSANNEGRNYSIYATFFKTSSENVTAGISWRGCPEVVTPDGEQLYHAIGFNDTHHAINRITVNIYRGQVNEFEVYYSDVDEAYASPASDENWTKVATVSGSFTDSATVEIADAPKAEYWKIKATDFDDATALSVTGIYEVGETELSENAVVGSVSDGKVTLSLDKYNDFLTGKKAGEAKVYFALYDDGKVLDAKAVDVNLDDTADEAVYAVYSVPAGVSGTLTLKAFIWNNGLQPLTSMPVILR